MRAHRLTTVRAPRLGVCVRAPRLTSLGAVAAIGLAPLAGGCGSSGTPSGDSSIQPAPSGAQSATGPTASTPPATPTTPANPKLAHKPVIAKESGPAPTTLVARDLVPGTGPAVKAGQMLTVQYVGVLYKTGKQFDASWDNGQPFTFALGTGGVIPGWDKGLPGMHVGGRRQLIIPASLAYGAQGHPPAIPPNSPLIFDIDVLSAQ